MKLPIYARTKWSGAIYTDAQLIGKCCIVFVTLNKNQLSVTDAHKYFIAKANNAIDSTKDNDLEFIPAYICRLGQSNWLFGGLRSNIERFFSSTSSLRLVGFWQSTNKYDPVHAKVKYLIVKCGPSDVCSVHKWWLITNPLSVYMTYYSVKWLV